MSEMKQTVRYDYNYLENYCSENSIILLDDYSKNKINRETVIRAKCIFNGCINDVEKTFRMLCRNNGCLCKTHTCENKKEKIKTTCIEKYGVGHPSRSHLIQDKIKATCLEKYGVSSALKSDDVKIKIRDTMIKNHGVEYPTQSIKVKNKIKKTCMIKYGVEYSLQSPEIRKQIEETNLKKYNVKYTFQSDEIKDKIKNRCIEKYGCEYALQTNETKDKMQKTWVNNYGVKNPSQSQKIKDKKKETTLKNYGVEFPGQSSEVKRKIVETSIKKYGVKHPAQNTDVAEKASKNAYSNKDYIFPSGRIEKIQGYENLMIDELLEIENIAEEDIFVKRSEVPIVWYKDLNGIERRYFVDCLIKSQNRCIEVKSTWTAEKKKDCIFLKQQACKDAGYECEIWVYNKKGEKIECHK